MTVADNQNIVPLTEQQRYNTLAQAVAAATVALKHDLDPDPDRLGYASDAEEEYGIDLLPMQWKGKPDSSLWIKRTKARARQVKVAKYHLMGMTSAEISRRMKVSVWTVYQDVKAVEQQWQELAVADVQAHAARALARLDRMFIKLWPSIEAADPKAIDAGVNIIKEQGTILGYRTGMQIDVESYVRQIAQANGYDPDKAVEMGQRISLTLK